MAKEQAKAGWYEPVDRDSHRTAVVGDELFLWAGNQKDMPSVHDGPEKRAFLSHVDVFSLKKGSWKPNVTSGVPPLAVKGYACVAMGNDLHYFGGWCGHFDCIHNSVHKLNTSSLQWSTLASTSTHTKAPMKKSHCGLVAFRDSEEEFLFVVGGVGTGPTSQQPKAEYRIKDLYTYTNEQHLFSLKTGGWISPIVTGQPPPPCSEFSLMPVGDKKAAMFGSYNGSEYTKDLLIVELERHSVSWTKMSKPVDRSVSWPEKRSDHVDTCISGPVLAVVGGWGVGLFGNHSLNECWICDTISKLWSKLPLPESITRRRHYSVSTFQVGPQCVWLVVFGGKRKSAIACTAIVELVQGEDGQWNVGMVMEGAALSNKQEYQDKLAKARAKTKGLPAAVEDGTMTEKQLRQLLKQLHKEKEDSQIHLDETEKQFQNVLQMLKQEVTSAMEESIEMGQEKEFLQRKQSVTETALEKLKQAHHELQETHQQLQETHRQLQQSHRELQQSHWELQQKVHTRTDVSQQISQKQEEQPSWVVNIEEVEMTDKELGRGGYGVVTVAQFRGLRVAAKRIHETIISPYNRKQFTREMDIIAKLRHPNLLLFIGATREGELVILTELMSTSLRKELEKRALTMKNVAFIS